MANLHEILYEEAEPGDTATMWCIYCDRRTPVTQFVMNLGFEPECSFCRETSGGDCGLIVTCATPEIQQAREASIRRRALEHGIEVTHA